MQPNADDWVACPKCEKKVGEWDQVEFKKSVTLGKKH
jgi:hypothetical protein